MSDVIYESHVLKPDRRPLIFHYDIVSGTCTAPGSQGSIQKKYYKNRCIQNWHENIELLYIKKGSGYLVCNTHVYNLTEGCIGVINSYNLHYVESDTQIEYYCLIPDISFLEANDIDISSITFNNIVTDIEALNKFDNIVSEFNGNNRFSECGIKCAVLNLILYLCRFHASFGDLKRESKTLQSIRLAIGYMKANLSNPLTIEQVAFEVGLSKYHFIREFKKITGSTVISFLNDIRCEKAKNLLLESTMPVAEICNICGFENSSYFSKIFKQANGLSPSEYRKIYKNSAVNNK
ncbi:MAG: AraC family transcriptional regulator [Bacillota bacterium]|nr:AraC family transcriptional regulator [Bacillota bacterium]